MPIYNNVTYDGWKYKLSYNNGLKNPMQYMFILIKNLEPY